MAQLEQRVSGVAFVVHPELELTLKGGPIKPTAARRYRLRSLALGIPSPALQEFIHLSWLRERLFQAPEPIAALESLAGLGFGQRGRRPVAQLLATRTIPGAKAFDVAWEESTSAQRESLCRELGRELGRMHALTFLHADLYPRNVLVSGPSAPGERVLWFIDAWAGGASAWTRGSGRRLESDLGCWLADFSPGIQAPYLSVLLDAYLASRSDNGRPVVKLRRWQARVSEERRAELRRWERQRYRLRGEPFPPAGFPMPLDRRR